MKCSLILFFLAACISGLGQQTIKYTERRAVRMEVKEYTVVKDSTGKQYDYAVWKPKYDSGDFTLTKKELTDTVYTLKWLSPEMKKKRLENAPPPRLSPYFKNGEKMRSFSSKDISGNKVGLEQFHGKIVVINFFLAGDCASCKREISAVNAIVNELGKDHPVEFLAVSRYSRSEVEEFLGSTDVKHTIVSDAKEITGMYGINIFPVYVVIDGDGIVRFHTYGTSPRTVDYIRQTIISIIKEKGTTF
jgi:peroxiredoxin